MDTFKLPGAYLYEEDFVLSGRAFPPGCVERVKDMEMGGGDVVIVSYPKAGTTWMQEILYQIHTGVRIKSEESRIDIRTRVPFMEKNADPFFPCSMDVIEACDPPRLMKSHLPARFFEKNLQAGKGKFIIVMRNGKDSLTSYYNFYRVLNAFQFNENYGSWDDFFEMFKAKVLMHGDWLDFNLSWWELRESTHNVLIVKYEDMKKDVRGCIRTVANFVGKALSQEQINELAEHVAFEKMKSNEAVNFTKRCPPNQIKDLSFMNKGTVGTWKSFFTLEQNHYFEEMYVRVAAKQGLTFEYEA